VNVEFITFTCEEYKQDPPLNKLGKISLSTVINQLVLIDKRNDLILDKIVYLLNIKRKIIFLSDRRNHCEEIFNRFNKLNLNYTSGLYMGGMKQSDLKENEKCNLILATFSLAHEGLDIPDLDTLILATPKTDIVQSCGRIMRETKGKKNNPLIIDINDLYGSLPNQGRKRKIFYKSSGFVINGKIKEKELESPTKTIQYAFVNDD